MSESQYEWIESMCTNLPSTTLQSLGQLQALGFDKTGTLTQGVFRIHRFVMVPAQDNFPSAENSAAVAARRPASPRFATAPAASRKAVPTQHRPA